MDDKRWAILTAIPSLFFGALVAFNIYERRQERKVKEEMLALKKEKLKKKTEESKEEEEEEKNGNDSENPSTSIFRSLDKQLNRKRFKMSSDSLITRICITGGPCAGKTTALAEVKDYFEGLGFHVFVVPEAATLLMKGGAMIMTHMYNKEQSVRFQVNLIKLQMYLEEVFTDIAASTGKKSLLVCDRGVMDGSAYMEPQAWQALLDEEGWHVVQLRDKRYEAVCHLVTAADGAEEFYDKDGNVARYESVEDALKIDRNLQRAYLGHPHFHIIDNRTTSGFNSKIKRCINAISSSLNLPTREKFQKKFLLKKGSVNLPESLNYEQFDVEETYLISQDSEEKVRRRGQNGSFSYVHHVRKTVNGQRVEKKTQISARDYMTHLDRADSKRQTLIKKRVSFIWDIHRYNIDTFVNVKNGPILLLVESHKKTDDIVLPEFVQLIREVTGLPDYTSYILSKIDWYIPEEDEEYLELALNKSFSETTS